MALEFTVRTATLEDVAVRGVQRALRGTCMAPLVDRYVDHIDVLRSETTMTTVGGDVVLRGPAQLFLVSEEELTSHPNAAPPGSLTPAARIDFRYAIRALGKGLDTTPSLALVALQPEGQMDGQPLSPAVADLVRRVQPALDVPLSPLLTALGLEDPLLADTSVVDGVVVARYGGTAPATARLASNDEWGVFLGTDSLDPMIRGFLQPVLERAPEGTSVERIDWKLGSGPPAARVRVGITYTLSLATPIGPVNADAHAWVDINCGLALLPAAGPGTMPVLRLNVQWSFHLQVDGAPGFVETIIEDEVHKRLRAVFNPVGFGGQPAGDRRFLIDRALPEPVLMGEESRITSLASRPDGVLLSGYVRPRPVSVWALAMEPGELSPPFRMQLCSELAKSGSGASTTPQTVANSRSVATVRLRGIGMLCGWEVLPPNATLASGHVTAQVEGEDLTLSVSLPYREALTMAEPLRIRVRSSRGVRLFDLGRAPTAKVDDEGNITDGWDWYIPNCLHLDERFPGRLGAGLGLDGDGRLNVDVFRGPPKEDPDWASYVGSGVGLSVQLVTLDQLEPGEMVQVRTSSHAIDVTADAKGRASVPVIMALDTSPSPALVVRASGAALPSMPDVATVDLLRTANVPVRRDRGLPAMEHLVPISVPGLRREHLTELLSSLVERLGEDVSLNPQPLPPKESGEQTELNPQPLPPHPDELRQRLGIAVVETMPIPGFESEPLVVAVTEDGTKLLVDVGPEPRVAGTFRGPIGRLAHAQGWALAQGANALALLEVRA